MKKRLIVYLHGLQSSPFSFKAQLVKDELRKRAADVDCFCPQLPLSPEEAVEEVSEKIRALGSDSIAVIGSSLGGYYASWLAEQYGCRAVLLNPVVDPWKIKILDDMPDRSELKVREWLDFREKYAAEINRLKVLRITRPERYLLLAATGDELLDWRLMQSHYAGARQIIIEGGDHGLSGFGAYVETVLAFCGIGTKTD